jgi:hypothetical protein
MGSEGVGQVLGQLIENDRTVDRIAPVKVILNRAPHLADRGRHLVEKPLERAHGRYPPCRVSRVP